MSLNLGGSPVPGRERVHGRYIPHRRSITIKCNFLSRYCFVVNLVQLEYCMVVEVISAAREWRSVLRHCVTRRKVAGLIPACAFSY
jgi:hypothetical protein